MRSLIDQVYGDGDRVTSTAFTHLKGESGRVGQFEAWRLETDRGLDDHMRVLGVDFLQLPQETSILVVGSGASRQFERELHDARPDLAVFSIDPFLAYGGMERFKEGVRQYGYTRQDAADMKGAYDASYPNNFANETACYLPGAIAGGFAAADANTKTHHLPIRDSAIDLTVAFHSLPQHLPYRASTLSSVELNVALLQEVERVTNHGGMGVLYPFYKEDIAAVTAFEAAGDSRCALLDLDTFYIHASPQSALLHIHVQKTQP